MAAKSMMLLAPALAAAAHAGVPNETRIAPPYHDASEMTAQPGQPQGSLRSFTMLSVTACASAA